MKAQTISMDLIISTVFIIVALIAIMLIWSSSSAKITEEKETETLLQKVIVISNILVKTGGIPSDWNSSNVDAIGLASREGVVNSTKFSRLKAMSYTTAKSILGVGVYEFYLSVIDVNGTVLLVEGQNATFGMEPNNAFITAPIDRFILLDNQPSKLRLIIWI